MIYLFGKSQTEIFELIKEDEMRTKMTREEAKRKLKYSVLGVRGTVANEQAVDDWLNGLEALGLIKFEEAKIEELMIYDCDGDKQRVKFSEMEKVLHLAGYKIVKI